MNAWRLLNLGLVAGCSLSCRTALPPAAPRETVALARVAEPPAAPSLPASSSANSFKLKVAEHWLLNPPGGERFDASALLLRPDGHLYTVNDKSAGLYRIDRRTNGTADLLRDPKWFTPGQLTPISAGKTGRWDLEGLAQDADGRIYFCEELNRWVLRADPQSGRLERLDIDWSPVKKWFSKDVNASWEGIAVGTNDRLYLANERSIGRIIVVDLKSLRVVDDFQVAPLGHASRDFMYSDLCWHADSLWVLCRQSRRVVQVDPASHRVLADFDYTDIELSTEFGYGVMLPYGQFEGLAVDATNIWLVIDNNGTSRVLHPEDRRPTLFRCPRPDRPSR